MYADRIVVESKSVVAESGATRWFAWPTETAVDVGAYAVCDVKGPELVVLPSSMNTDMPTSLRFCIDCCCSRILADSVTAVDGGRHDGV